MNPNKTIFPEEFEKKLGGMVLLETEKVQLLNEMKSHKIPQYETCEAIAKEYAEGIHIPELPQGKTPDQVKINRWLNIGASFLDTVLHSIIPPEIIPLTASLINNLVESVNPSAFSELPIRAEWHQDRADKLEKEIVIMKIRPTNDMPIMGSKPKGASMAAGFRNKKTMAQIAG